MAGFESDGSGEPMGGMAGFGSDGDEDPAGGMAGFEVSSRRYRLTVSRSTPSSRATLRADQPLAASVAIECCRLTSSWFIALVCGLGRTQRNPTLKVAGFHLPIPGWF
jgi:hypothetical protein